MSRELTRLAADVLLSLATYPAVLKFAGERSGACAVLCANESDARGTLSSFVDDEEHCWELVSIRSLP